jgi:hypothetical protein
MGKAFDSIFRVYQRAFTAKVSLIISLTANLPVDLVISGVTCRLQASTNLVNWSSIQTSTPPADPAMFVDRLRRIIRGAFIG